MAHDISQINNWKDSINETRKNITIVIAPLKVVKLILIQAATMATGWNPVSYMCIGISHIGLKLQTWEEMEIKQKIFYLQLMNILYKTCWSIIFSKGHCKVMRSTRSNSRLM